MLLSPPSRQRNMREYNSRTTLDVISLISLIFPSGSSTSTTPLPVYNTRVGPLESGHTVPFHRPEDLERTLTYDHG